MYLKSATSTKNRNKTQTAGHELGRLGRDDIYITKYIAKPVHENVLGYNQEGGQ